MESNKKDINIVARAAEKVIDGLITSTIETHMQSKLDFANVKTQSRERHLEATKPNPDFEQFKATPGIKGKAAHVIQSIKSSCKTANSRTNAQINAQKLQVQTQINNASYSPKASK